MNPVILYSVFVPTVLLVCWDSGGSMVHVAGLTVTIDVDYTPPPDFVGGPNDYRAASSVTLTCKVSAGTSRWSSTCTGPNSNCFVPGKTTETITRTVLRSTDSGNHTCNATRGGSATIEMNVVGAGIYVVTGDDSVPTGVLPNNGIGIAVAVASGDRISFQCRSGSLDTGVGQLVDLDGNIFAIGENSGVFIVQKTGSGSAQPGSVQFRNRVEAETLTAAHEGVYTCRIPDETGNDVDVNIGVYRNGFNTPPTVSSLTYDSGTQTLTCTSTVSPATTVTWTKDGDTLTVDGTTYSMTQTVTDRRTSTYENVLTLPATGDISGNYSCQVGNEVGNSNQRTGNLRTPASLQVEITTSGGDTAAGEQYTLTCTVTVPDGLSCTLTVVWTGDEGMTGVTEGTAETSGRVTTLTLTFNPLRDSQDGVYTCMATFSCQDVIGQTASAVQNLEVVVPEVTVTVSAIGGAPIVGGTSYSLTCDHDAPQSLIATVQSTLTTPDGTMLTSLPHSFDPLRVTDGGQYSCSATVSSPYLTGNFPATQGTPLNVVVEIPSPGVEAAANPTGTIIAGSVLTLTCTITLDGGLSSMLNDLSVTTVWTEDGQEVSTGDNIMVSGAAYVVGTTYSSTLSFITVRTNDAGDYTCTATVSPRSSTNVPANTVMNGVDSSDQVTVSVNVPTITVTLEPNTTRLPTEPPYNTFTITYTATAPEGVVAGKTIEWKRRIGSSTTGLMGITDNGDTIRIVTTNPNQPETTSVLTVTETTPGDYRYRCRVDIHELGSVSQMTEDVYPIDVIGPTPPVEPTNLMDISTSFNSATIQWAVPLIAFTPETYVVHYGTNMGSLDLMSGPVESGDDFVAENTLFTVQLNGLHPGTLYYYHVSATNSNASTLSDIELFQTGDQPPSAPPQDFIITTVSGEPTMLHFSWDPPPENKQNGNITNYRLSCNPDPFGGVPKVFHQSSNIDVTLDGFKPATTYQCRVSAGTSAGYGPDGTTPIMTLESTPGSPPQNVRLIAESPSSVLVTWLEPDVPNGVIILYTVYVNGSMDGTTEGTVTMYTITGLQPHQLVTVSVSAHTTIGEGPESNATSVRSMEAAPGKVSNLVVVGLDSTTLYVSWDRPVALNGILQNYTIFVNEMDSGENIAVKEVDVSTQNITIKDHLFGPGIPYNVSVAAVNSAGRGELESVIAFTEEETPSAPRGIAVIRLNKTHVNVSWELLTLIQARGHVTNYTISYQPTGTVELETKVVPGDQSSVVIGGLDPYEAYSVQVWANTAAGRGITSETLTIEAMLSQKAMIFQLQLTGIHNCREWVSFNADAKVSDIHTAMQHDIEHLCMCGFTTQHLSDSELQCFMNLEEVTFRALIIGTAQATSSELIEYIEQWIAGGPRILVQTVRLTIDDTCHPVEINTFNDPECGTESPTQTAQPDNTGAIVAGVVVATVLIIAIISVTVVVIVILILKNRHANISLQRKGDPVKWMAKSGEITIAGCAAYGAVHQQPESHDYEFPENYAVISQTDNPPAEAVYEPIPGDSQ